eukprot:10397470-Heterocapsa_arctica.AAC.1
MAACEAMEASIRWTVEGAGARHDPGAPRRGRPDAPPRQVPQQLGQAVGRLHRLDGRPWRAEQGPFQLAATAALVAAG